MKFWGFVLSVAFVGSLFAADLETKSGKVYKNYTIEKVTPYGLAILHDTGGATVSFSDLPDDLRAQYKEEEAEAPAKIKQLEKQKQSALKRAAQEKTRKVAELEAEKGKKVFGTPVEIIQVFDNSVLARNESDIIYITGLSTKGLVTNKALTNATVTDKNAAIRGAEVLVAWRIGTYTYSTVTGGTNTVAQYTPTKEVAIQYYINLLSAGSSSN